MCLFLTNYESICEFNFIANLHVPHGASENKGQER